MKKLTIGSAVYDDYEGVYFSYQSIRLNNQNIKDDLDLVIIDNNPESAEGKATKNFCESTQGIRYIPFTERRSTAVRNEIFNNAEGEFCMSIDCHVLFEPDTIKRLINYFSENSKSDDLFHGPMLYDDICGNDPVTHMDPVWRSDMFGIWGTDKKGKDPDSEPFEIPMHGWGILAAKTDSWLGFSDDFIGFGGEEGYIHEKYRQHKRKIWCLPFLRWVHRFNRPRGVPYTLDIRERIRNYMIGYKELGLEINDVIDHFAKNHPNINLQEILDSVIKKQEIQIKTTDPPRKTIPRQDHGNFQSWQDSTVKFNKPSSFRYLKYEIINSYDGHGSLSTVKTFPDYPESTKVHSFSSQSETNKANDLLSDGGAWESHDDFGGNFPHSIVLDFGAPIELNKIISYPRIGIQKGLPTEFKVYSSNDLIQWEMISHVDIFKTN